jgi:nicotinate-nucleotide adenylyltransferase
MSRVGIFGGTFDPIHFGHLGLAVEAKKALVLNKIFLIPSYNPPHKVGRTITPIEIRINMAQLAVGSHEGVEVSEIELERGGLSYTIDTVISFIDSFPNDEFFLLVGLDSFLDMSKWRFFGRIFELCNIVVGMRPKIGLPDTDNCFKDWFGNENPYFRINSDLFMEEFIRKDNGKRVIFFQQEPCPAASSEIRSMIAEGKDVKNLLPGKVENYIIGHRLYQAPPPA